MTNGDINKSLKYTKNAEEFNKMYTDVFNQTRNKEIKWDSSGTQFPFSKDDSELKIKEMPIDDYLKMAKNIDPNYETDTVKRDDPLYVMEKWKDKKRTNEFAPPRIMYNNKNQLMNFNEGHGIERATYAKFMGEETMPVAFVKTKEEEILPYMGVTERIELPGRKFKKYNDWRDL